MAAAASGAGEAAAGLLLTDTERDVEYMKLALEVAAVAYREGELPVGCVYADAYTGKVVTAAANRTNASYNATTHAELVAINSLLHGQEDPVAAAAVFRRCVLYVTLEPCIMCASAVARAGVLRVVYGAGNDKFGGCGSVLCLHQAQALAEDTCYHAFSTRGGVLRGQAVELLRRFYCQRNIRAPKPHRRRLQATAPPALPPGGVPSMRVSAAAAAASAGGRGKGQKRAREESGEPAVGVEEGQPPAPSARLGGRGGSASQHPPQGQG